MQDLVKDFLDKKEKNQLLVQRSSNLLKTLLQPVSIVKFMIFVNDQGDYNRQSFPSHLMVTSTSEMLCVFFTLPLDRLFLGTCRLTKHRRLSSCSQTVK